MPSPDSESPDDSFFNDLSQQTSEQNGSGTNGQEAQKEDSACKPKRMACVLCRKRKLRCDGVRPTCGTCKRLSHECAYDEVRKKSGPKRGYVKLLEQRLLQVESLLKNQESNDQNKELPQQDSTAAYVASTLQQGLPNSNDFMGADKAPATFADPMAPVPDSFQNPGANGNTRDGEFPWEMIGLGLEEPLPPQDVMDDLYQVYFNKIHSSIPIIHRPRFMAAMDLAPHMRPPVCLRYIMWALAASSTDKYDALQEHFYQRARKYAQMDEMKGHGETTITIAHCQAWTLLCTYEFKQMYFPRAWLSAGRSVRLAQMMQLHRLDGAGLDVKQCLPPPKDWTEREERRRTFWMSFCIDRYAAIGTGWPVTIDESDILTNLPASEMAYEKSKPMPTGTLDQALSPNGITNLQPFGGIVLTAALFGRNLLHLHRPGPDDREDDLNAGFWTRHRSMEQILLQTSLGLPEYLRLPSGLPDVNVVFLNMCLHTSAICLHQAAIFKADKHRLPVNVSNESKIRCVTAAAEIASIMRMISHMDLSAMNPFISFCVYVAARVFVQYLKTRPKDQQMNSSLQFLLQAMQALRRKNPLTESFLVQLDLDLESAGIMSNQAKPYLPPQQSGAAVTIPTNSDSVGCSPIFEIRESQSAKAPMNQFRNGNAPKSAPGSHFHVPNMDLQNSTYLSPQAGQLSREGHSPDSNGFMNPGSTGLPSGFGLDASNEMDISVEPNIDQPSPATTINSQSRGGSTSHTSYSPASQNEQHHLPYRASPKVLSNPLNIPQTTASNSTQYFSTSDTMFSMNMYNNAGLTGDSMNNAFLMGNEWEFSGMNNTNMALPPMTDGGWNEMLDSINLGWDSLGPPREGAQQENKQR